MTDLSWPKVRAQEGIVAWIEQTGEHTWRVRYIGATGKIESVGGFDTREVAEDYALVMRASSGAELGWIQSGAG
jgi:hypothetical protein